MVNEEVLEANAEAALKCAADPGASASFNATGPVQVKQLTYERDEARVELEQSSGRVRRSTGNVQELMGMVETLTTERNTTTAGLEMPVKERDTARANVQMITAEHDADRTESQAFLQQTEEFYEALRDVESTNDRLRRDMQNMNRRRGPWYRDYRDFGTRAWFVVSSETRMMVRDMWVRADRMCVDLDLHMHDIVAGLDVDCLMDNGTFEAYEEELPLQEQG